jgi:nucleoside-diphosphate-sugar epimerase
VTGAGGSVGRALVERLQRRGTDVVALDLRRPERGTDVEWVEADLRDGRAVEAACRGVNQVFHAAAFVETRRSAAVEARSVNVDGTRNLLAAATRCSVEGFVYISTASVVYEGQDISGGDESLPYARRPMSPYPETKALAERAVLGANGRYGLFTCALRPDAIYGPTDLRLVPTLLALHRSRLNPFFFGSPMVRSDFTSTDNLVEASMRAVDRLGPRGEASGQAFFITDGTPCALYEFTQWVCEDAGLEPPRREVPLALLKVAAELSERVPGRVRRRMPARLVDMSRFSIDFMAHEHWYRIDKARDLLGYDPIPTRDGVRATVASCLQATARSPMS